MKRVYIGQCPHKTYYIQSGENEKERKIFSTMQELFQYFSTPNGAKLRERRNINVVLQVPETETDAIKDLETRIHKLHLKRAVITLNEEYKGPVLFEN